MCTPSPAHHLDSWSCSENGPLNKPCGVWQPDILACTVMLMPHCCLVSHPVPCWSTPRPGILLAHLLQISCTRLCLHAVVTLSLPMIPVHVPEWQLLSLDCAWACLGGFLTLLHCCAAARGCGWSAWRCERRPWHSSRAQMGRLLPDAMLACTLHRFCCHCPSCTCAWGLAWCAAHEQVGEQAPSTS